MAPLVRPERRVLALNAIHFAARTVNRKVELDAMCVGFRLRAFTHVQKDAHLDRQAGLFEKLTAKALDDRLVLRFQSTTGRNPHLRARFGHFLERQQYPILLIEEDAGRANSMLHPASAPRPYKRHVRPRLRFPAFTFKPRFVGTINSVNTLRPVNSW